MEGTVELSVVLKMIEEAYDRGYERASPQAKLLSDPIEVPEGVRSCDLFRVISKGAFTSTQGDA